MSRRSLAVAFLTMLACSRSPEDAGIVLNVDSEVAADRAAIDMIAVTVDGTRQKWALAQPLPGSLGIVTSPGNKLVTVEGVSRLVVRARWSKVISAVKGQVVVCDVHLAPMDGIDAGPLDGGALDSGTAEDAGRDWPRLDAADAGPGWVDGGRDVLGAADSAVAQDTASQDGKDGGKGGNEAGSNDLALATDASDAPVSPSDAPAVLLKGSFAVGSDFEIPATSAATGKLADTLALTHGLAEDPGTAILDFAEDAQLSELATLRSALPDALESQLAGWMNAYIRAASVNGISPYERLAKLDSMVRALLLVWRMQSTLALPSGNAGTHTPTTFIFDAGTGPVPISIDAALVTPGTGVTATVFLQGEPNGGADLTISDHAMALPFGRYALPALNAILLASDGAPNTAAYLSNAVDCLGLAQSVASRCVAVVCVGHVDELSAICEAGLAEGARQIEARILDLDFKALRFERGTATAMGAEVSVGQATSLQDGVWTSTIDFGDGARAANAIFSAISE